MFKECYGNEEDMLLAYKLAIYSVATNRVFLKVLTGDDRIPMLDSNITQFIVAHYNSESNKKFEREKNKV